MGARETALNALIACRKSGAWPNGALKEYIARDRLSPRDAALATRLCYGVLQNRNKLDFYLKQLLTGRLKDLHPVVRDILHLGLYQIYELDKIPESAAVNESVTMAKKYCKNPKAGALVNAVLRKAAATKGTLQEPVSYADRYSHPDELISLLKANLPKGQAGTHAHCRQRRAPDGGAGEHPPNFRGGTGRAADGGTRLRQTSRVDGGLPGAVRHGKLEQLPAFREGLFYVQDPAAKLSVLCAGLPESGGNVLDCCAAPGGKSFAAAIAMGGKGSIVSCDIYPHKTALIENGAARLGLTNITARQQDASQVVPEWVGAMDTVIADVPCSGLGIIRKKPDIRYKNLKELEDLPALQLKILETQASYVRPGGTLLYSTCTVLKRENEDVVSAFLAAHGGFTTEPLPLPDVFPKTKPGCSP